MVAVEESRAVSKQRVLQSITPHGEQKGTAVSARLVGAEATPAQIVCRSPANAKPAKWAPVKRVVLGKQRQVKMGVGPPKSRGVGHPKQNGGLARVASPGPGSRRRACGRAAAKSAMAALMSLRAADMSGALGPVWRPTTPSTGWLVAETWGLLQRASLYPGAGRPEEWAVSAPRIGGGRPQRRPEIRLRLPTLKPKPQQQHPRRVEENRRALVSWRHSVE